MRNWSLALLLVSGCGPATAVLVDPDLIDADADTDADSDVDTDTDADTDTEPAIPTRWLGDRTFTFAEVWGVQCVDTIHEDGDDVTTDADWSDAVASCGDCDQVFLVQTSPDAICDDIVDWWQGIPVANPVLRGVHYNEDDSVDIYRIDFQQQGPSGGSYVSDYLATGSLASGAFVYSYSGNITGANYTVDGEVELLD